MGGYPIRAQTSSVFHGLIASGEQLWRKCCQIDPDLGLRDGFRLVMLFLLGPTFWLGLWITANVLARLIESTRNICATGCVHRAGGVETFPSVLDRRADDWRSRLFRTRRRFLCAPAGLLPGRSGPPSESRQPGSRASQRPGVRYGLHMFPGHRHEPCARAQGQEVPVIPDQP